jgi:secretion/DNA translocation related TadE-like protein
VSLRSRVSGERGSATVWVVALAGVLAAIGVAAVLVGAPAPPPAADLAALAAAEHAVRGDPGACAAAGEVAGANGARLTACTVGDGAVVEVAVAVPVRLGPLGVSRAGARARAGPVAP